VGKCVVKKPRPSSNFKVTCPTPGSHAPKCGSRMMLAKDVSTPVKSKRMLSSWNRVYRGNTQTQTPSVYITDA